MSAFNKLASWAVLGLASCAVMPQDTGKEKFAAMQATREEIFALAVNACSKIKTLSGHSAQPFRGGQLQVDCLSDGSVEARFDLQGKAIRATTLEFNELLPKPKNLSLAELPGFLKNKRVVLFGESHGRSLERFIQAMKTFKQKGFTHIAIEYPFQGQEDVIRYFQTNDEQAIRKSLGLDDEQNSEEVGDNSWSENIFQVIKAAKAHDLQVVCFDDRPPVDTDDWWKVREERNFANVDRILQVSGNRVIGLVGGGHATAARVSYFQQGATTKKSKGKMVWVHNIVTLPMPLGRQLINKYGPSAVGNVLLNDCDDFDADACMTE